ncbi:hypothetical protein N9K12_03595 [Methylophilaceae bacterium]|nr:hypothetical protein [Methylophilaceae bacterium]
MSGAVKVALPLALTAGAMYASGGTAGAVTTTTGGAYTGLTSMMQNPLIMSPGVGGGLLAGFSSALSSMTPFQMLATGTSVLQGINSLSQGNMLQSQYDLQAQQIQAQNEVNKLNYINNANEKARRLMAVNASALAAGYAGGVNGLDGSVKLIMKENEKEYISDLQMAEFNQLNNDNFADAESSLLRAAGDSAAFGSKVEALGYIGSAAKLFEESRIPT